MCKKYLFYIDKSGNSRNGRTAKRLESESGSLDLEVPRDRNGSFEPKIVEKRQRRAAGLDDTIVYLYAQGQSTRTIQQTLKRLYGAEVSSTLISEVTSSVLEEVNAWQARPLESVYPIVYFDALFVKSREEGSVKTRAVYVALAIDMQGEKQVLGLWIAPTEGAVSWLNIFSELQARGMQDCFIACVDGLKGLPEALDLFSSLYAHTVPYEPLLEQWGLADKRNAAFGNLSGGQKQRLFIALALVNDPEVVFLDELTSGLDPQARRATWELVRTIRTQGKTVVLVTHFMDEAEHLCDRIAIVDQGKIIALDTPAGLVKALDRERRIVFDAGPEFDLSPLQSLPPSLS